MTNSVVGARCSILLLTGYCGVSFFHCSHTIQSRKGWQLKEICTQGNVGNIPLMYVADTHTNARITI